jgi:N-acetylglutamate synthase-like GNAT family acetyltransferase
MNLRVLKPDELEWANGCYEKIGFKKSSHEDFIVVAEVNGANVGLGRVVRITESVGELGGIHVLPEHGGGGIAGGVVDFLIKENQFTSLYCIPFMHLQKFYRRHGFEEVLDEERVPKDILEKFDWCKDFYSEPVLLMCREG